MRITLQILTHTPEGPRIRRFRAAQRAADYLASQQRYAPSVWCHLAAIGWIRISPWRVITWRGRRIPLPA